MPQITKGTNNFAAAWDRFATLRHTQDSLALQRRHLRRVFWLPFIGFLIPIEDPAIIRQITTWQATFADRMAYAPQPVERLHITLHYVGALRRPPWPPLPHTWRRSALPALAGMARAALDDFDPFTIRIGPLNAFPNALIAEVHDDNDCLRAMRTRLRRALPLRARPLTRYPFLPHVTLGFWGEQPAPPLVEALRPYRDEAPQPCTVDAVRFTIYTQHTAALRPDLLELAQEETLAHYRLGRT